MHLADRYYPHGSFCFIFLYVWEPWFFSFTQNFPVLCSIFLEAVNWLILSAVSRYDARLLSISKSVLGERLIVIRIKNWASGCLKGVPPWMTRIASFIIKTWALFWNESRCFCLMVSSIIPGYLLILPLHLPYLSEESDEAPLWSFSLSNACSKVQSYSFHANTYTNHATCFIKLKPTDQQSPKKK